MSPLVRAAVALGLCALVQAGVAQDRVYRCGAEGRSYSQEPCAAGRTVEVDDARSAQQLAQARQVAQRDAQLADALAREHQRHERQSVQSFAAGIGSGPAVARACPPGKRCAMRAADKRQHDKPVKVTLYRATQSP